MILYCFSDRDENLHYFRGKVQALAAAREAASRFTKDEAVYVEAVTLATVTTKELVVRCLNREDFLSTREDGEPITEHVATIKGKLPPIREAAEKPRKKEPLPDLPEQVQEVTDPDEEWVTVWTKNRGYRPRRVVDLRRGDQVPRTSGMGSGHVTW